MERIKIAFLGTTHEHATGKLNAVKKLGDLYEIVGVYDDTDITKAAKFSQKYQAFYDYPQLSLDELLNYPGLQAVCVETPNNELVSSSLKCMERGLAMHMDKPAGEDLPLFKQLLDGCKAAGIPFQMGYMFRGNPAMQMAAKAVKDGWIGDVFDVHADMNHCYGGPDYQVYISNFRGGLVYNLICHFIDYYVSLLGVPNSASSIMKTIPGCPNNVRNNCLTILDYDNLAATIRSCSYETANTIGRRLKISGTKGYFEMCPVERFDKVPLKMTMNLTEPHGGYEAGKQELDFGVQDDRYTNQFIELAAVIRGEAKPSYSYEHDYKVHKVLMEACGI